VVRVVRIAPRLDERLVAAIGRLDDPKRPIAETWRRAGVVAEWLGLPRPSYEQVRVLVGEFRAGKYSPGLGDVLLEIAFRAAPPDALLDFLAGTSRDGRSK
jgi:hypothetical protein